MFKFVFPAAAAYAFAGFAGAEPPAHVEGDALTPGISHQADLPSGPSVKPFKRGDYLPVEYRGNFIEDRSGLGLKTAPDGYRWVRVDGKAYQIRITTGLITDTRLLLKRP